MEFEKIKITDINPASYNPRTITEENYQKLKDSLGNFGLIDPIIINLRNNNTIIGGHQRYKALLDGDNTTLYLIRLGDIGWVFTDTNLKVTDENMEKLMNINLNQTSLMGEWDTLKLTNLFEELENEDISLDLTGFDENIFDELEFGDDLFKEDTASVDGDVSEEDGFESKYTTKLDVPHYQIKGDKPLISELFDDSKTLELQKEIRKSNIKDEELLEFLNYCTYRFLEFNYSNIAEFYAHADKETQEMMEKLVLVIIDFQDAVSNGWVKYSEKMKEIINEYYGEDFEEIR